jgi:hypothetical protein
MEGFADRGLEFRLAMIACIGMAMATGSPGWMGLAVAFAFAALAMWWVVQRFVQAVSP